MKIAVLDDYQGVAQRYGDWSVLGPDAEVTSFTSHLSLDEAIEQLADFDVLCGVRERMPFPRKLLESLPKLKFIVFTGKRAKTVDSEAAKELGIELAAAPSPGYSYIHELAFALIMSCVKGLAGPGVVTTTPARTAGPSLLAGQTIGLLGFGRIGIAMVAIAKAFNMRVIAWSENLTDERAAEHGAIRVTREALFRQSDILSVHMRLSDRTVGLVGEREFAQMKPTAVLVNTARAPVVDEAALIEALAQRRIRAACLDVHHREPLPKDHPLNRLPTTLLTPHVGYWTTRNFEQNYSLMIEQILAWQRGTGVRFYDGDDGTQGKPL